VNCAAPAGRPRCLPMRDLDTIDSELRLLAVVRWSIREHGGEPSSRQVDELLDWRRELTRRPLLRLLLAHREEVAF